MPNSRVYYACHAVAVQNPDSGGAITAVPGVQSVSMDTNFDLESVFQLGRLAAYDSRPVDPSVEITMSKLLDGHPTIYNLFDGSNLAAATSTKRDVYLMVGSDKQDILNQNDPGPGGVGIGPVHNANPTIKMTGCNLTGVTFTFGSDGNFSEDITITAASKQIVATTIAAPAANPKGGGVLSRQNFLKNAGVSGSQLPKAVQGKKISQITISADTGGAESFFELGNYLPFLKQAQLPIDVTIAFDVIADNHDGIGVTPTTQSGCSAPLGASQTPELITLYLCNASGAVAYEFNFNDRVSPTSSVYNVPKAKLTSVSYSGGDTGGGNVTITYTYTAANLLRVVYTG